MLGAAAATPSQRGKYNRSIILAMFARRLCASHHQCSVLCSKRSVARMRGKKAVRVIPCQPCGAPGWRTMVGS